MYQFVNTVIQKKYQTGLIIDPRHRSTKIRANTIENEEFYNMLGINEDCPSG